MEIHYSSEDMRLGADIVACLQTLALQLVQTHPLAGDIQVIITDDAFIKELNARFRAKDTPTDVLSFPLDGTADPTFEGLSALAGEIYISYPRAQAQAQALNVPLATEMARLFTHGFLHLAGWTHDTLTQLEAMEKETDRMLSQVGLLI